MSTRMKMIVMVAVAVLATSLTPATAALITTFSGNTQEIGDPTLPGGPPSVSGTVNFAVFNRDGGNMDVFGTGSNAIQTGFTTGFSSGALDTTAAYLYVYQVVNDGPNPVEITSISQDIGSAATATSWGFWAALGLNDGAGNVGSGNPFGTSAGFSTNPPTILPTLGGGGMGTVVTLGTAGNGIIGVSISSTSLVANWIALSHVANQSTALFGFTSNYDPHLARHNLLDSTVPTSNGYAASPAPEPTSLVLLGIGALCGIPGLRRRMKKQTVA